MRIPTWGLFGAMAAVFGVLAFAGSSEAEESSDLPSLPTTKRLRWEVSEVGATAGETVPIVDGKSIYTYSDWNSPEQRERVEYLSLTIRQWWTLNRLTNNIPSTSHWITDDGKSRVAYPVYIWMTLDYSKVPYEQSLTTMARRTLDEYGRGLQSEQSDGGGFDPIGGLSSSFSGLMANPLFKAAVSIAIVAFGGPAGIAVYGAYNAWQARGGEWSLQNVALSTARAYAVSQCGPACGVAFDMGVGIASGDSVDVAAENALYGQMTPEERAMYDEGKAAYNELA